MPRDYAEAFYAYSLSEAALLSLHYQLDDSTLMAAMAQANGTNAYVANTTAPALQGRVNMAY